MELGDRTVMINFEPLDVRSVEPAVRNATLADAADSRVDGGEAGGLPARELQTIGGDWA